MNSKNNTWVLYVIAITIILTVFVQVFWNFKNYQENKKVFINSVQESLDNALDTYFSVLARKELHFSSSKNHVKEDIKFKFFNTGDSLKIDSLQKSINSLILPEKDKIKFLKISKTDSSKHLSTKLTSNNKKNPTLSDTLLADGLTSIFISITDNDIHLKKLKKILLKEFDRKQLKPSFKLNHYYGDVLQATSDSLIEIENPLKTYTKTSFLKQNEKIELLFANQTLFVLKKGFLGILLSLLLSVAIISSLFYLLNIIKKQKQLAEIKNDFISNITHEFKTPITTIGLATDAIKEFAHQKNTIKTNEYLEITKNQLKKLQLMVEKVLETSILDQGELRLEKKPIDIVKLIHQIVKKHTLNSQKFISFKTEETLCELKIDSFHFENAINNLIDNAVKYGGNCIEIRLKSLPNSIEIFIEDNGEINKVYHDKLFDKFYRIPQGNTHNIKGFGIGLYYTKKIIEKHNGSIELTKNKQTTFKITLAK